MADCFIIMPITTPEEAIPRYNGDLDHFMHVLEHLFVPAIEKAGMTPVRPIAEGADIIHATIIANLEKAECVLCDMSCLNPNVFFELGIRTALDLPVCMVQDDVSPEVPFDWSIINYHKYESALDLWSIKDQIEQLATHVTKSRSEECKSNALWQYFGITRRAHTQSDTTTTADERIEYLTLQIDAMRKILEQSSTHHDVADGVILKKEREGRLNRQLARDTGLTLQTLRVDKQMTVKELARKARVEPSYVAKIEAGEVYSTRVINKLLAVLEADEGY